MARGPGNPYHDKLGRFSSGSGGGGSSAFRRGVKSVRSGYHKVAGSKVGAAYGGVIKAKRAIAGVAGALAVDFVRGGPTYNIAMAATAIHRVHKMTASAKKDVATLKAVESKIARNGAATKARKSFKEVSKLSPEERSKLSKKVNLAQKPLKPKGMSIKQTKDYLDYRD